MADKEPIELVVERYKDFIPAFRFYVFFVSDDFGTEKLGFSEVSGLSVELQTEDVYEGGGNAYVYRLPKASKPKNLVLKRAIGPGPSKVIDWAKDCIQNLNIRPLTVVVTLTDASKNQLKTWNIMSAYAVKLAVSDFNANKNELVIETLELAYQALMSVEPDKAA